MSTLTYHQQMIVVEDGVFRPGTGLERHRTLGYASQNGDVIPSGQVIEQMDRMSAKLSPPREV